jgi:hypothetical protein
MRDIGSSGICTLVNSDSGMYLLSIFNNNSNVSVFALIMKSECLLIKIIIDIM